jgi:D-serine dehydratase
MVSRGLLELHGVEGFEGILDGPDGSAIERSVSDFLTLLADTTRACAQANLFAPGPVIVSAGGSAYYDLVLKLLSNLAIGRDIQLILRSGCYLTHDSSSFIPLFQEICRRMPEARGARDRPWPHSGA